MSLHLIDNPIFLRGKAYFKAGKKWHTQQRTRLVVVRNLTLIAALDEIIKVKHRHASVKP